MTKPASTTKKPRRQHTPEFRQEALKLAERIGVATSKFFYFIVLFVVTGRFLGDPEMWFDDELATAIGHAIYGPEEIGADNYYDLYLYLHVATIFPISIFIYVMTMKLINAIRRK